MMTIAQQIEQESIEKNKLDTAKKLLTKKLDLSETDLLAFIQPIPGLSHDKIESLRKNMCLFI